MTDGIFSVFHKQNIHIFVTMFIVSVCYGETISITDNSC